MIELHRLKFKVLLCPSLEGQLGARPVVDSNRGYSYMWTFQVDWVSEEFLLYMDILVWLDCRNIVVRDIRGWLDVTGFANRDIWGWLDVTRFANRNIQGWLDTRIVMAL